MKDLFNIQNKTNEEIDLFIYGDITSVEWDETDMTAMKLNNMLNELKDVNKVNLRVCSGGGNVYQGIAIYNSLKNYSEENNVEITAVIDSIAASISSVIVLAANKVYAYESSDYMIHYPIMGTFGNQDDHRESAEFLERMTEKIIDIYQNKTGLDREKIKSMMKEETWLTGKEAYHYGFVDEVKDSNDSNSANNVLNKINLQNYKNVPKHLINNKTSKFNKQEGDSILNAINTEPRTPEYDGTEDKDWDVIDLDLEDFVVGFYKHTDEETPENYPDDVSELSQAAKNWISSKSLLGNADAEMFDDLVVLPVVNPDTDKLNKSGLESARSTVAMVDGISEDTIEKTKNKIDNLLQKEFNEGGNEMENYKVFETEAKFDEFKNSLTTGYVKADEVLAKFNDIDLEGEDLDSIVNVVKELKNDLNNSKAELEKMKEDKRFSEIKATLEDAGIEVKDEEKEDILALTDYAINKMVASAKVKNDNEEEPFDPNFKLDNSENSDIKNVVSSILG